MWSSLMTWLSTNAAGQSGFVTFLKNVLNAVISIFIENTATTGDPVWQITQFGEVFFGVVGIGFILWALGWIVSLMRLRRA